MASVTNPLELPGSASPEMWRITSIRKVKVPAVVNPGAAAEGPVSTRPVQRVIYKWKSETRDSRKHDREGIKLMVKQNQEKL